MANLGFIGLGQWQPYRAALAASRHSLTVYDRNAKTRRGAGCEGRSGGTDPAEVAVRSEIVLSCVADDAAVEAVLLGRPHGALEQVRPSTLIIDLSTISR